jgi:mannose-1-phosphate guanylyltransferase
MKVYGLIMAGGGGTRFWPLSRKKVPKQLLNLDGKEIMLNETIDRLSGVVEKENIFIVTNTEQVELTKQITSERVLENHILAEPSARNTAACIQCDGRHLL